MTQKVILVNLPGESVRKPEEHCGLAIIHAFLTQNKIETEILDGYAQRFNMSECMELLKQFIKSQPEKIKYVGISAFVTSYENFLTIGSFIHEIDPNVKIFAGGHFATLNKEYLLQNLAWLDAIVVGEGEFSVLDYVSDNTGVIEGVYRRNQPYIPRKRIDNLDDIPFQTRYLTKEDLEGQPYALTTSRGCYGACSFCSISSFYNTNDMKIKQTFRSAKHVFDEIIYLIEEHSMQHLKIVDDNFFRDFSDVFLEELSQLLKDVDITIRLSARPNDINSRRASLLKDMGVTVLGIGVESADNASLQLFNKGITVDDSENAIACLEKENICCLVNFIMFHPLSQLEGVKKNCEFVEKYKDKCLFHRINSHLWIRSTDPIVDTLVEKGICQRKGFPYIHCDYISQSILDLRHYFDIWCEVSNKEYYALADILMAKGVKDYQDIYSSYKEILANDLYILKTLIAMCEDNLLEKDGDRFIQKEIKKFNERRV